MLRIHLFSIFTIKTPRALAALTPLGEDTDKCTLTITCDRAEYDGFLTKGLTRLLNVLHLYISGPLFTGIGVYYR